MAAAPRSSHQRKTDSLARLRDDKDMWISTASSSGVPSLVPLSFWWNEPALFFATKSTNPTSENVNETGTACVIVGHTRDVTSMTGAATLLTTEEAVELCAQPYVEKCGWNPLEDGYVFHRFIPDHIEVWRELNEHSDRLLMENGGWTV